MLDIYEDDLLPSWRACACMHTRQCSLAIAGNVQNVHLPVKTRYIHGKGH